MAPAAEHDDAKDDAAEAEGIRGEVPVERQLTGERRIVRFTVGRNHGRGWRLDKYLHALCPTLSRTLLQRWVGDGHCAVDGRPTEAHRKLRPGQRVELSAPHHGAGEETPPGEALRILHADPGFLVVDKPAGVLAHQAGKVLTGTLINQVQDHLRAAGRDPRTARLVNRIDRDTSGLVLVSLDEATHQALATALDSGALHKEYRAICTGVPTPGSGSWLDPIAESDDSIAMAIHPDGKPSHTDYAVLATAPAGAEPGHYALLRVILHTGRQHQIRIHAAHHGHPLVGDWVYGQPCAELPGQALHAAVLAFPHPRGGAPLRVEAPLPPLLAALWQRLADGGEVTPLALSAEQRSKLGHAEARAPRRPRWLSDDEFAKLRQETGQ